MNNLTLNPRFEVVRDESLGYSARNRAESEIQRLTSGRPTDMWGGLAKRLLPRINEIIATATRPQRPGQKSRPSRRADGKANGKSGGLRPKDKKDVLVATISALHNFGDPDDFVDGPFTNKKIAEESKGLLTESDVHRYLKQLFPRGGRKEYRVLCTNRGIEQRLRLLNGEAPDLSALSISDLAEI